MSAVASLFIVLFIALGLAVTAAAIVRSAPSRRSDRDEGDGGGGGGGSQRRVPPRRPPEPPGASPDWWPRFEREFAEYASRRRPSVTSRAGRRAVSGAREPSAARLR
jgi:hypothetical protein